MIGSELKTLETFRGLGKAIILTDIIPVILEKNPDSKISTLLLKQKTEVEIISKNNSWVNICYQGIKYRVCDAYIKEIG